MDFIDYEAMVFALGGDTICPSCGIGVLIPEHNANAVTLCCDICDEEFDLQEEEPEDL